MGVVEGVLLGLLVAIAAAVAAVWARSVRGTRVVSHESTFSTTRVVTRIVFNGVEYDGPEDMPPGVRAEFDRVQAVLADRDGDGTPDVFEAQPSAASRLRDLEESHDAGLVSADEYEAKRRQILEDM